MRRLILAMTMSLDGVSSGPRGDIRWMFVSDDEAIAWKMAIVWNSSLHIMESHRFQATASRRPTSVHAADAPDSQSRLLKTGAGDPEDGWTCAESWRPSD
nr:hypothetical protein [uncultured Lichenicoccus sp.]